MADKNLYVKLGVDNKDLKKDLNESKNIFKGAGQDLEKEAARMALAVSRKIENMNINSQARQLQNLTAKMMEAGLQGTKAFAQTAAAAGKLRANIDDAKGVIEAFRPDAPFKALSTTLQGAAQGFAGVQGAMALFGAESEDVQKTLLKVQAAMAFSEGFKAIDALSDGFEQLNLIIKANPLIAGVAAFTAVVAVMAALADRTVELSDAQKANNLIAENSVKIAQEEYGEVEALKAILLDETLTRETRTEALQKLQNKYPDYLNNLSIEKSSLEELATATDKVSEAILKRARVQAAMDKLTELGKQQLAVDLARAELEKERFTGGGLDQSAFAKSISARENFINATEAQLKREIKIYADYVDKTGGLSVGGNTTNPTAPKTSKSVPVKQSNIGNANDFTGVGTGLSVITTQAPKVIASMDAVKYSISQTSAEAMRFAQSAEDMRILVEGSVESLAVSVAGSLGKAFAGEDINFGNTILLAIADFGEQLGKMMIGVGVTIEAFKKSLATLNPVLAIAGGVALIAAASAARSYISKGGEGFAEGGLIGGNSFTGDKLLAPVNSGEVVLNTGQQNELLRMANGMGGGGGQLTARVSGKDLLFVLDRTKGGYNRG